MLKFETKNNRPVRSKKGKLRYATREYSNPFFNSKNKRNRKSRNLVKISKRIKVILLILLIFILASSWFLLYSAYFQIESISTNGQGNIDPKQIEKIANAQIEKNFLLVIPQGNIFLFNTEKLISNLNLKYAFDQITVEKKLPDKIVINYEEKKYAFIYLEGESYYYADREGRIITEVSPLDIKEKDYPIVQNNSSAKINNKQIDIDELTIEYTIALFGLLKNYTTNFTLSRIIIDDELNTVKAQLLEGPTIYFNTREDSLKQINKLLVVKNEKLKNNFNQRSYIDVRYGDSVYYR